MSHLKPLDRPSKAQIEAKSLSYYHSNFKNRDEICKFMEDWKHTDGSFILRDSFSTHGALTVTVWHQKNTRSSGLKHFNIKTHKDGFYLQDDLFASLDKLINFYSKCKDIPNEEGLRGFRLTHPINNHDYAEIPSEDGYEEFLRRASPPLPPRKFSLDVSSQSNRLSSSSDSSTHTGSDSAFSEGEIQLPVKSPNKKGFLSVGKRNKSTSDIPPMSKSRPLPAPPRMSLS